MRAGDRLVIDEQDLLRRVLAAPDQLHEEFRILAAGGMRDADGLPLRLDDVLLILRGKRLDRTLPASLV